MFQIMKAFNLNKKRILPVLSFPYGLLKSARNIALARPKSELRVLLYHDIPKDAYSNFAKQLDFISKRWGFITPAEFESFLEGKTAFMGKKVLLTFDDGFYSNFEVERLFLRPRNIKAIFFVAKEFIECDSIKDGGIFIKEKLKAPISTPTYHRYNMGVSDLERLIKLGHSVGHHTSSHAKLSKITSLKQLRFEIIESGNELSKMLGVKIQHFAYPFGSLESVNANVLDLILSEYRYVHTGIRKNNSFSRHPRLIGRDAINGFEDCQLVNAYLSGVADFRYAKDFARLGSWVE